MGLFERLGKWIDRGIERILGKPADKTFWDIIGEQHSRRLTPSPEKVRKLRLEIREKVRAEARALWREERKPKWERDMEEAIDKHREEGMSEEELIERYGEENL